MLADFVKSANELTKVASEAKIGDSLINKDDEEEALMFRIDAAENQVEGPAKLEDKLFGDGEDVEKLDLYQSFERTLPFAEI